METMKVLVDVEPTDAPMNRQDAIKAAKKVATVAAEKNGIKVASVDALYSRIDPTKTFWQVVTQIKEADFPPKDDEEVPSEDDSSDDETPSDDSSEDKPKGDDLPSKLHDVIDEHAAGEEDSKAELASTLSDLVSQMQSIVDELGGNSEKDPEEEPSDEDSGDPDDVGPEAPAGPSLDFMPGGGPAGPGGPPVPPRGRPKPPMMSATLPRKGVSYEEAFESAKQLPKHDPALRGLKLAGLDTSKTSYTARFTR